MCFLGCRRSDRGTGLKKDVEVVISGGMDPWEQSGLKAL